MLRLRRPSVNWILSVVGRVAGGRSVHGSLAWVLASCPGQHSGLPYKSCGHRAGTAGAPDRFCLAVGDTLTWRSNQDQVLRVDSPHFLWGQVILRWVNSLWKKGEPWGPFTGKTSKEMLPPCASQLPDSLERKRLKMIKSRLCRILYYS